MPMQCSAEAAPACLVNAPAKAGIRTVSLIPRPKRDDKDKDRFCSSCACPEYPAILFPFGPAIFAFPSFSSP
jgi:hypothetical protein